MKPNDRQCEGKQRHSAQGTADAHMRALIERTGADPLTLNVYFCDLCSGWHVGRVTLATVERSRRRQRKGY